jgi:hypothetical protein
MIHYFQGISFKPRNITVSKLKTPPAKTRIKYHKGVMETCLGDLLIIKQLIQKRNEKKS